MDAIERRIAELKAAQYHRASTIEKALKDFEKRNVSLKIRTPQDYVLLSKHQRLSIGLDTDKVTGDLKHEFTFKVINGK